MAKYGSNSLIYEFDNSVGTLVDMTQHTLDIGGVEIEAILEESHSFGDAWVESLATGMRRMNDVTVGGFYDDTATTGPDAIYRDAVPTGPAATAREFKVTWGGSKTTLATTWVQKYSRIPGRMQLTRYSTLIKPTGAVTEA